MMISVSTQEKEIIDSLRAAPKYADFEVWKRPTKRAPNGEVTKISLKTSMFFDLSTPKEMETQTHMV